MYAIATVAEIAPISANGIMKKYPALMNSHLTDAHRKRGILSKYHPSICQSVISNHLPKITSQYTAFAVIGAAVRQKTI